VETLARKNLSFVAFLLTTKQYATLKEFISLVVVEFENASLQENGGVAPYLFLNHCLGESLLGIGQLDKAQEIFSSISNELDASPQDVATVEGSPLRQYLCDKYGSADASLR